MCPDVLKPFSANNTYATRYLEKSDENWENRKLDKRQCTVCPGNSNPPESIESNYFIQLSSFDLKSFCSLNE